MSYDCFFDNLDKKLRDFPDFPRGKAARLWQALPSCSPRIAALIYLLPFGEKVTAKELACAETLSALTLSIFVHDDMTKNRAFTEKESVLYGDFLFALAFSLLPHDITGEDGKKIVDRVCRFNETCLAHRATPENNREYISFARDDYGSLLRDIAAEAGMKNQWEPDQKESYEICAETLGTIWGLLCERYPVNPAPLLDQAKVEIDSLRAAIEITELTNLWKELKKAALEYHFPTDTTEK